MIYIPKIWCRKSQPLNEGTRSYIFYPIALLTFQRSTLLLKSYSFICHRQKSNWICFENQSIDARVRSHRTKIQNFQLFQIKFDEDAKSGVFFLFNQQPVIFAAIIAQLPIISVTRLGKIQPLWQNLKKLLKIFEG